VVGRGSASSVCLAPGAAKGRQERSKCFSNTAAGSSNICGCEGLTIMLLFFDDRIDGDAVALFALISATLCQTHKVLLPLATCLKIRRT
jgi:hypothetical protein